MRWHRLLGGNASRDLVRHFSRAGCDCKQYFGPLYDLEIANISLDWESDVRVIAMQLRGMPRFYRMHVHNAHTRGFGQGDARFSEVRHSKSALRAEELDCGTDQEPLRCSSRRTREQITNTERPYIGPGSPRDRVGVLSLARPKVSQRFIGYRFEPGRPGCRPHFHFRHQNGMSLSSTPSSGAGRTYTCFFLTPDVLAYVCGSRGLHRLPYLSGILRLAL